MRMFFFFQLPAPPLLQLNPKHSPMPLNLNKSAKSLLQYRNMRARFIRQDICIIRWWPRATGAVINSRHRIKRCVPLPQGCAAGIAYSYVCTCVCVSTGSRSRSRSACLTSHMANEGAAPLADYDTHNTHTYDIHTERRMSRATTNDSAIDFGVNHQTVRLALFIHSPPGPRGDKSLKFADKRKYKLNHSFLKSYWLLYLLDLLWTLGIVSMRAGRHENSLNCGWESE